MLSTAPILALVLLMVTSRPTRVSGAFLLGWFLGVLTVAGVLVAFVDLSARPRLPPTAAAITRLVLGALLAFFAVRTWLKKRRAAEGEPAAGPSKIASWTATRAASMGFALGSVNPKNLALVATGATAILEATTSSREQAVAVLVFALVASVGMATPIVMRTIGGPATNRALERSAAAMTKHGKLISIGILALISGLLISQGIAGLDSAR